MCVGGVGEVGRCGVVGASPHPIMNPYRDVHGRISNKKGTRARICAKFTVHLVRFDIDRGVVS